MFRKHCENKRKSLVYYDYQNIHPLSFTIITSIAEASFVFLRSWRSTAFSTHFLQGKICISIAWENSHTSPLEGHMVWASHPSGKFQLISFWLQSEFPVINIFFLFTVTWFISKQVTRMKKIAILYWWYSRYSPNLYYWRDCVLKLLVIQWFLSVQWTLPVTTVRSFSSNIIATFLTLGFVTIEQNGRKINNTAHKNYKRNAPIFDYFMLWKINISLRLMWTFWIGDR